MTKVRVLIAAAVLAILAGLIYTQGSGAQPDAKVKAEVDKIVDAVAKGNMDGARSMAQALAKKSSGEPLDVLEELAVMDLFKKKDKGGYGYGKGPKELDGIEVKYREIARDGVTPAVAKSDAEYIQKMAHRTVAISLVAEALTPKKAKGTAQPKNWTQYIKEMQDGGQALAKAKGAADIKTAATKVNTACNSCHSEWRNK